MSSQARVTFDTASTDDVGMRQAFGDYWNRVRGGDIGSLPAVLGLFALVILFGILQGSTFLSVFNFANLLNQSAAIIVIAMGLVFVLLLGEIDLSAGFAAGTAGAILGVTLTTRDWPWPLAVGTCLASGAVIGTLIGMLVARLGIPSFVVTLAAFLALQGLMLLIIGEGGTIPIRNDFILAIMNNNLAPLLGWVLFGVLVIAYGGLGLRRLLSRRAQGLPTTSLTVWAMKLGTLAILLGLGTYLLNQERSRNPALTSIQGIPVIVPVIIVLLLILTFVLERTPFGRHVYAVGGNTEAARRAGINVATLKVVCFMICSTLAAFAGILFASRDNSISPSTGGSTTLLYAVGAAVIGGTSLFGGRGKIRDAILGGLVVAVIANGLPLITQQSGIQYIVTGGVLLIAASVDAISRRRAAAAGR